MMWLGKLLAAIGIVYDVLRCVACGEEVLVRKGDIAPPGWVTSVAGWICPACAPSEACKNESTVKRFQTR